MTTTAVDTTAAAPDTGGLVIHQLLSRGYAAEAQVLLALVSSALTAPPDDDIWVGIDRTKPEGFWAIGTSDGIESPRPMSMAELKELDLWPRKEGALPFDLPSDGQRRYWLARFDFTDHLLLRDQWMRWVQQQNADPARVINVIAWRSRHERRPGTKKKNEDWSYFEPVPGHASFAVSVADVVPQPLFELGVLFVHGIGKHGVRETLVRWSEPIVSVWRERWLRVVKARLQFAPEDRARITSWLETHQLRNRAALNGIEQTVSDFEDPGRNYLPERPRAGPATLCFAATRAEQTLFGSGDATQPSATLVRLSEVDTQAVLRERHVLFAEAFWAREAFPPTFSELYTWLTQAVPIAMWSRLQRLFWTVRSRSGASSSMSGVHSRPAASRSRSCSGWSRRR